MADDRGQSANSSGSVDGTAKAALIWLCLAGIIALILFIVYSLKSSRGKKSKYHSITPYFTLCCRSGDKGTPDA